MNDKKEQTMVAKKKSEEIEVNGAKLTYGAKFFMVRDRSVINPLPADWRAVPNDVVEVVYKGFNVDENEHVFEEAARPAYALGCESGDLDVFVFPTKAAAKSKAEELGKETALFYAREDYEREGKVFDLTSKSEETIKGVTDAAGSTDLTVLANALGQSTFEIYKGMAGDLGKKRKALFKCVTEMQGKQRAELHSKAKAARDALVEKWGDIVKVTNDDAAAAEEEKAKEARKKAKEAKAKEKAKKEEPPKAEPKKKSSTSQQMKAVTG